MTKYTVSAKGWMVISEVFRDKYGLTPGTKVIFIDNGGSLAIVPVKGA